MGNLALYNTRRWAVWRYEGVVWCWGLGGGDGLKKSKKKKQKKKGITRYIHLPKMIGLEIKQTS